LLADGFEELAVGGAEGGAGEQVGAVGEGLAKLLFATPAADLGVVAVEKDFGSAEAGELGGAGVVGVVEQAAGAVLGAGNAGLAAGDVGVGCAEAFECAGGFVAEDAGNEAHDGVDDDGGGELAATEDVVADGELQVAVELVDALVDAFIAAAEEDDAVEGGEFAGEGLGEGFALGGEQDDAGLGSACLFRRG
jgi:hypothetical protein